MTEIIGYSNYLKQRLDALSDRTYLLNDLILERKAIIAHRFSKHTVQPYSLTLLKEQIKRGIRLIEFDVSRTNDADPNDRIFYLSHGTNGLEEVAPEDRPGIITKDNYNKSIINYNNQAINTSDTLPSLREAWNALKTENVLIFMEAKTTAINELLAECIEIGLTPDKMIFQDFDISQLNIFKNAGYKTMFIKNGALTQTEVDNYDYFCCNISNITTFQNDNKIDKFFYYTNESPQQYKDDISNNSKLVGCFSDCALPTFKQLTIADKSLLNPINGHISVISDNQNLSKNTRVDIDEQGNVIIDFMPQGVYGTTSDTYITFHSYTIKLDQIYTFRIQDLEATNSLDWVSILFRLGGDYLEKDNNNPNSQAFNIVFRKNLVCDFYELLNGSVLQDSSITRTSSEEYIHILFNSSVSDMLFIYIYFTETTNTSNITSSTKNISLGTQKNTYSKYNFPENGNIFLSVKRDDTCNGKITFYGNRFN